MHGTALVRRASSVGFVAWAAAHEFHEQFVAWAAALGDCRIGRLLKVRALRFASQLLYVRVREAGDNSKRSDIQNDDNRARCHTRRPTCVPNLHTNESAARVAKRTAEPHTWTPRAARAALRLHHEGSAATVSQASTRTAYGNARIPAPVQCAQSDGRQGVHSLDMVGACLSASCAGQP